jgi:hypothetical protein
VSSLLDQLTALYVLVDDFLTARPELAHWRQSPHHAPAFSDSEVLTLALFPGRLGVASWQQTYRLLAANYRSGFPPLCSDPPWIARRQALSTQIRALLAVTTQVPAASPTFYLSDAKPIPVCQPVRQGRVRLLREEGAWFGKTSQGLVLWLQTARAASHWRTHGQSGIDAGPWG